MMDLFTLSMLKCYLNSLNKNLLISMNSLATIKFPIKTCLRLSSKVTRVSDLKNFKVWMLLQTLLTTFLCH